MMLEANKQTDQDELFKVQEDAVNEKPAIEILETFHASKILRLATTGM